jgi:hypothetical protein
VARKIKLRLGELLVQHRVISPEQLKQALEEQHATGRRLGKVLAERGFATEQDICQALAVQLNIPFISLQHFTLDPPLARRLPEPLARRARALPLEERDGQLLVAMCDPSACRNLAPLPGSSAGQGAGQPCSAQRQRLPGGGQLVCSRFSSCWWKASLTWCLSCSGCQGLVR